MLRLHYVPGGHGSHVSGHRGQNGVDVRGREATWWNGMEHRDRPWMPGQIFKLSKILPRQSRCG